MHVEGHDEEEKGENLEEEMRVQRGNECQPPPSFSLIIYKRVERRLEGGLSRSRRMNDSAFSLFFTCTSPPPPPTPPFTHCIMQNPVPKTNVATFDTFFALYPDAKPATKP